MATQRTIETLMAVHLGIFSCLMLAALAFGALIPSQHSLASADFFLAASFVSVGVLIALGLLLPVFPWLRERSLLVEWHTTSTGRLRRLMLPIPAIWGVGVMALLALMPGLGALSFNDAVITEGITAVALVVYAVAGPRSLAPPDREPAWHVRRFESTREAYEDGVRTLATASGFSIATSAAGVLSLSNGDETLAEVRPRRKGGVYARVRDGTFAPALKQLMEDAAKPPS